MRTDWRLYGIWLHPLCAPRLAADQLTASAFTTVVEECAPLGSRRSLLLHMSVQDDCASRSAYSPPGFLGVGETYKETVSQRALHAILGCNFPLR